MGSRIDNSGVICFGGYALDFGRGRLKDPNGRDVYLRAKSYRLLEELASNAGSVLSKDECAERVWPNLAASDDSIAHCVHEIRKALGPAGAQVIRTVPRRGYMLVADATTTVPPHKSRVRKYVSPLVAAAIVVAAAVGLWRLADYTTPTEIDPDLAMAFAAIDARDWRRRADVERARATFEDILDRSPDNADAKAGLATTYWLDVRFLRWGGGRREMANAMELAKTASNKGGSIRAQNLLVEMQLLSPFAKHRDQSSALRQAEEATRARPRDVESFTNYAEALALTGDGTAAVGAIESALALSKTPHPRRDRIAGLAYFAAGDPDAASEAFREQHQLGVFNGGRDWAGWIYAASLAEAGRPTEASAVIAPALLQRPGLTAIGAASALDGTIDPMLRSRLIDGLRRAGMPG